jgi:hypothetical protein
LDVRVLFIKEVAVSAVGSVATYVAPLGVHVCHVVSRGAENKVVWAHAGGSVAAVHDVHSVWDRPNMKGVGKAVGHDRLSFYAGDGAVALLDLGACPKPAAVRDFHAIHEAVDEGSLLWGHDRKDT